LSDPVTKTAPRDRGILVIISSPSGAGKTTLARRLLAEFPEMQFSVSFTTRPPRPSEVEGVDYHFVDEITFERMVHQGAFAEHASVHGNNYGTAHAAVENAIAGGRDVVFDVDWQGGRALSAKWPADALKIFILPPDLDTLESRLRRRATDVEGVIQRRLRKAIDELEHYDEYDDVIVNDDLDRAYDLLRAIYLVRRNQGARPRPELPWKLDELAALVTANRKSDPSRVAQRLIAEGRRRWG
jgi:guanylate kinase